VRVLHRHLRVAVFAAVCLSVLVVPAPAVAAPTLPTPAGWPLRGAPRVVQRGFAPPTLAWASGHRGVDLVAKPGEPILAAASGTVRFAGSIAGKPVVSIDHGSVRTTYEPVVSRVRVGERVALGQLIGVLGAGGHCHGCLHWGLREGKSYLDPLSLLGNRGGRLRLVAESQREVVKREAQARALAASAKQTSLIANPAGRPGGHGFLHPVAGAVTSAFGMRLHPLLKIWKLHDGTDFAAVCGTAIRAPYAGVVTRAYFNPAYGNRLFVNHGNVDGVRVESAFNHAARYTVRPGQRVSRGQVIGEVGRTGLSTGCHLHLMVWLNGRLSNPMSWL
jgi:murein DD-endopeptidase MepM/ murein hydrolase activator NlpD